MDLEFNFCGKLELQSGNSYKITYALSRGIIYLYYSAANAVVSNGFEGFSNVAGINQYNLGFDHTLVLTSDISCEPSSPESTTSTTAWPTLTSSTISYLSAITTSSTSSATYYTSNAGFWPQTTTLDMSSASSSSAASSTSSLVATASLFSSTTEASSITSRADFSTAPTTQAPSTKSSLSAFQTPLASTSTFSPPATTTTLVYDGTCDGVKDGDIVCRSPNTFNFCVGGKFVMAEVQRCADGTVCCKETNKCDFAFNCPSLPKDTADRCHGKSDSSIICTAPDKFKICASGQSTLTPELSCQPGLFCCETLNRCDTSCPQQPLPVQPLPTSTKTAPPPPAPTVPGPAPTTCALQGDGNIVCKTLKTFNFCINGQFLTSPDLSCPNGTVCCASSQSCDFQFNCKSVRPTAVNPPPATNPAPLPGGPVPTILPATCQGRPNGSVVCRSATTFNFCIDNVIVNAIDQNCPLGTVCCQAKNTCDFASNCPPVVVAPPLSLSPSPSPSPSPSLPPSQSSPSPIQAITTRTSSRASTTRSPTPVSYGSCAGADPGSLVCMSRKNFKYCQAEGIILDSASQPCPFGTICCASTRRCILPGDCPDPAPTVSSEIAPPQPTSIFNRFCGSSYTGLKCTGRNTFNFCESGVLNHSKDQTCAGGLVCCPTLGACTFEAQCPIAVGAAAQDYVPPVPAYTGQGVAAKVCNGVLDGAVICLTDKEFNYCLSDAFLYEKPMACPSDTVCCIYTNRCEWAWNCKPKGAVPSLPVVPVTAAEAVAFGSCIGFAAGGTTCVSETDFVYCNENGPLLPLIRKTCVARSVCCASTGVCQLPDSCPEAAPAPPQVPPAPIAVAEPTPSPTPGDGNQVAEDAAVAVSIPSPAPSASIATQCEKADMNTLFCKDETRYEVCTGEGEEQRSDLAF
ncbi:hypothetical protein HDU96_007342 [Phlyctochytrium bullatum]|nr:hypothetical protein HDU96_007342 [Phlyctochytrium bullatum]